MLRAIVRGLQLVAAGLVVSWNAWGGRAFSSGWSSAACVSAAVMMTVALAAAVAVVVRALLQRQELERLAGLARRAQPVAAVRELEVPVCQREVPAAKGEPVLLPAMAMAVAVAVAVAAAQHMYLVTRRG